MRLKRAALDLERCACYTLSGRMACTVLRVWERDVALRSQGFSHHQAYWGSKWRFKIFDGLYTHPIDTATGKIVDVDRRFAHLQERLGAAQKGEDAWLNKLFENDDDVMKEVKDPKIVQEYCGIWLKVLNERAHEIEEARNVS